MAPGASSTNDEFREFYAPRRPQKHSRTKQREPMPLVTHQRSIQPHNHRGSPNRTKDVQPKVGLLGEIKNYKAGDEFVFMWKWVDDFMDKRRAKKTSSKSHNVNNTAPRQPKPTLSSSLGAGQIPRPVVTRPLGAERRQAAERQNLCEYQRHSPWGKLQNLFQNGKGQQAKKKADQARQRTSEGQATPRRDEPHRGRSNQGAPHQVTRSPPNAAESQPGIVRKPIPVSNKKKGEVQRHKVKITQVPPVHHSVHLQQTPSNNYRAKPSRGQNALPTRGTRFSDFFHRGREPPPSSQKATPSRDTQWTYAFPVEDDEAVRNRYSSVLDPAKAIKKVKEAEKAKGLICYACGSSNVPGGYRDHFTDLWICEACQKSENICPAVCDFCGSSSSKSGYAGNGLYMCQTCRSPTTPKELPPSPKSQPPVAQGVDEDESDDIRYCKCQNPCGRIEKFDDKRNSMCPGCNKRLTPFPDVESGSRLKEHNPTTYIPHDCIFMSDYESDQLYSDDSYETRATTPPAPKSTGLGIAFQDPEDEEDEEELPPPPPLKDSRYHRDSRTPPAMDYNQSYLRKPGTRHPYAPSPATKASFSSAQNLPEAKAFREQRQQQKQPINPTTYPYPSPLKPLNKPRPASSVYPTDEPTTDFAYPLPPIPQQFANRQKISSAAGPGRVSKNGFAGTEPVGIDGGRTVLQRRSSWYDFWKPVFEREGEKSP